MEPKFQTSFIPKKQPMVPTVGSVGLHKNTPHYGTSLFMMIAVVMFIVSLSGLGGVYAWKKYLIGAQAGYKADLIEREKQFDIDSIEQLKQANVQIDTARQLLKDHIALSQIFGIVGQMTVSGVQFMSLSVTATPGTKGADISMRGLGLNLPTVAFQSDVLNQLAQYGLRKIVKNPIMSDPAFSGKDGQVSFDLSASIDSASVLYERSLQPPVSGDPDQAAGE